MTRRKLLIISPWGRMWSLGGGAGVSDEHHFIDGFTRAGYEIHILLPDTDDVDAPVGSVRSAFDAFDRVHLHTFPDFFTAMAQFPVPVKRATWLPLFNAMVIPRALRLARNVRPDAVLGLSYYSTAAAWACRRRLGIPSCAKLFGVMDLVHTEWSAARYAFKNFEQLVALKFPQDRWVVLDDGTRGDDVLRARGVDGDRIRFLPNGVNMDWQERRIDRDAARARFGVPGGAVVVLFLARLVASKRPDELVRAIPGVGGDALFVFAGEGPEGGPCRALADELGVTDRVRFVGTVAHDDVPELMAAADIFVSTSNLTNKALPTCEAMICGVPVVAYDVGDTGAVVRTGETGILVRDADTAALSAAVDGLVADAEARERMSHEAARVARESFTGWDERIEMELRLFDELIASTSRAQPA